jgi:hypothetical protein
VRSSFTLIAKRRARFRDDVEVSRLKDANSTARTNRFLLFVLLSRF